MPILPLFQGLFLGGSLIVAIGAQNAYVIRTVTGARVLDGCVWVIMWTVAGSLMAGVLGE